MDKLDNITLYYADCIERMRYITDKTVDCIMTDPPYLYLKNQKLDRSFDEATFFDEAKRVLKHDGFIVLFGRGTSFYRWNTMLADRRFNFKEEIIWDKAYCTSPLMAISRVHETVSIHSKGKGAIRRSKVPYLEMRGHDVNAVCVDLKRFLSGVKNEKSLKAVLEFLQNNGRDMSYRYDANNLSISSNITIEDRSVAVMRSMSHGLNEKSIIRSCSEDIAPVSVSHRAGFEYQDRAANVMQEVTCGLNEKSIIRQIRDHYSAIHPTQKPVRLLERLLALTTCEGDLVLDPFSGSGSTAIACINTGRQFIGIEIDEEYYTDAKRRIQMHQMQRQLF